MKRIYVIAIIVLSIGNVILLTKRLPEKPKPKLNISLNVPTILNGLWLDIPTNMNASVFITADNIISTNPFIIPFQLRVNEGDGYTYVRDLK